jgi:hypothetical protein
LDLPHKNAHPNSITSHSATLSRFKASSHQIQSAIIDDFGEPMLDGTGNEEVALEDIHAGESGVNKGDADSDFNPDVESGSILNGTRPASDIPVQADKVAEV